MEVSGIMDSTTIENGGICSPLGFQASGVSAGIKSGGEKDIALIRSVVPAVAAGAFTDIACPAAPVLHDRKLLTAGGLFQAIFVNSGNANACTGDDGLRDTEETASLVADRLASSSNEILVASTGRIGVPLPMELIRNGIDLAVDNLSRDGGGDAALAIMTTDTHPKEVAMSLNVDGAEVHIGGIAKGAGMIEPQMSVPHATMLAFITTDASVERGFLETCLASCLESSFNRITVDGDTSTNDTVIALANGVAENPTISADSPYAQVFEKALRSVMETLARDIVKDGEGATKFVTVRVEGADTRYDAELCAKTIANSLLCKTAWFGEDPNWGRVIAAAGRSGASFDSANVSLTYDQTPVVKCGMDAGTPEKELANLMSKDAFQITLHLGVGNESFEAWTCDISHEYVTINADYHT